MRKEGEEMRKEGEDRGTEGVVGANPLSATVWGERREAAREWSKGT